MHPCYVFLRQHRASPTCIHRWNTQLERTTAMLACAVARLLVRPTSSCIAACHQFRRLGFASIQRQDGAFRWAFRNPQARPSAHPLVNLGLSRSCPVDQKEVLRSARGRRLVVPSSTPGRALLRGASGAGPCRPRRRVREGRVSRRASLRRDAVGPPIWTL